MGRGFLSPPFCLRIGAGEADADDHADDDAEECDYDNGGNGYGKSHGEYLIKVNENERYL